jgi:predicted Zn-dependent protease
LQAKIKKLHKKQLASIIIAVLCVVGLYFFGNINQPKKSFEQQQQQMAATLTADDLVKQLLQSATPTQKKSLEVLQQELAKATTTEQKTAVYNKMARFFQTEFDNEELTAFYSAEELKLVNSQKNLKFAANFILGDVINFEGPTQNRAFRAEIAKGLFEKALETEPNNDSLKIGLGGCIMHGATSPNPMKGTEMVLEIARRDTMNAFAQKMLGYGGLVSGQLDKALPRFVKAFELDNKDTSLALRIAINAKKWGNATVSEKYFAVSKKLLVNNQEFWNLFLKEYEDIKIKNQSSK